MLEGD
jgi:hypothetical protein